MSLPKYISVSLRLDFLHFLSVATNIKLLLKLHNTIMVAIAETFDKHLKNEIFIGVSDLKNFYTISYIGIFLKWAKEQ